MPFSLLNMYTRKSKFMCHVMFFSPVYLPIQQNPLIHLMQLFVYSVEILLLPSERVSVKFLIELFNRVLLRGGCEENGMLFSISSDCHELIKFNLSPFSGWRPSSKRHAHKNVSINSRPEGRTLWRKSNQVDKLHNDSPTNLFLFCVKKFSLTENIISGGV